MFIKKLIPCLRMRLFPWNFCWKTFLTSLSELYLIKIRGTEINRTFSWNISGFSIFHGIFKYQKRKFSIQNCSAWELNFWSCSTDILEKSKNRSIPTKTNIGLLLQSDRCILMIQYVECRPHGKTKQSTFTTPEMGADGAHYKANWLASAPIPGAAKKKPVSSSYGRRNDRG